MKFTFALIALFTTATLAAPPLYDVPTSSDVEPSSDAMPRGLGFIPTPCFYCGVRYHECMDRYVNSYNWELDRPTDIPQFYESQAKCVELMENHYGPCVRRQCKVTFDKFGEPHWHHHA